MGPTDSFDLLYSLSGLVVGFLIGLTGVGGGSLMTPILVLVFGVHPASAVGTDLLFAAATKIVGTGIHGWKGTIDWKIVRNLAVGSVPAAALTLYFISGVDHGAQTKLLTLILGVVLVLVAVVLALRPLIVRLSLNIQRERVPLTERQRAIATTILGFTLGVLVTASSVGAGAMGVTILLILYPYLKLSDLVGSDIVHAVPLTLIAGAGYWYLGEVKPLMLAALLLGSIPGVIGGSVLAPRLPDQYLRPVLAAVLAAAGLKMLF
ncbi:sulfite exporter TauE/SafE family protein [Rhizobium sp. C1]|uniref:sulfite exporter TauE/SafE family protein n=1 Tax=Rhizobium sp. C1 TaxID=1349799 RepID=UPI0022A91268|nr:sulfite exporter TauE/SafE family protein [Rhizobium sp. C1]